MTSPDLTDKIALVTGSTSGIGRAAAVALAERGAHVLVVGRNGQRGDEVVAAIRAAGGKADFVRAELGDADSAADLARRATEVAGRVDILVNNAGAMDVGPTAGFPERTYDTVFDTNVKAVFYLVAALAPAMAERGGGAVVNVTTMAAELGMSGMAAYGASKAAVNQLTRSWAAEFGPSGVRVNAVSPGPTRTPGVEGFGEGLDRLAAQSPAGHPARPEDIASAIAFLASPAAAYVQGAVLNVDGGRTAV